VFGGESPLGAASRVLEAPSKVLGVAPARVVEVGEAVVGVASPLEVLEIELEVLGDIPGRVVGVGESTRGGHRSFHRVLDDEVGVAPSVTIDGNG
jgi:hypothetical protein